MTTLVRDGGTDAPPLGHIPIVDVARGVIAGYRVARWIEGAPGWRSAADDRADSRDPERVGAVIRAALASRGDAPANTFVTVPVPLSLLIHPAVRRPLVQQGDLRGLILDVTELAPEPGGARIAALASLRSAGAVIAVGGQRAEQPELRSIVELRPGIIRLGRAWVEGIEHVPAKRSAIEVTGQLAGQLDAWLLVEDVRSAGELTALAALGVPLVEGPFVGAADRGWPEAPAALRTALPPAAADGPETGLRRLVYRVPLLTVTAGASATPPSGGADVAIAIDAAARPVLLLERERDGSWLPSEPLVVNVATSPREALTRALTRPRRERFVPLVCTDAAGHALGVVYLETLVSRAAGDPNTESVSPAAQLDRAEPSSD